MNAKEYNSCVDLYADRVFRFIVQSTRDDAKAKDIVQDAYLKLWEHHEDVSYEKARSWLFTAAYRQMVDGVRREKKVERMGEHNLEPHHDHQWTDLQDILHSALEILPEIQRDVILLRDYEGYSYEEIGGMTGLTEPQVKVYIFRGRKKLKAHLVSIDTLL